jgi:hypothetical protein
MAFAIAATMLGVFFAPLPWLRRPEAWLVALLLIQLVTLPGILGRFTQPLDCPNARTLRQHGNHNHLFLEWIRFASLSTAQTAKVLS